MPNIYTENCRSSERSRDLTTISTQMTHHWQHEHQYQLNSSSRSFAFSFCYAPHPVVVVFLFILGIWRLLIALASHFKAILPMCRSSIGWSCQFLLLLSSSPLAPCHSFSCSLTCHKPQVKKKNIFVFCSSFIL